MIIIALLAMVSLHAMATGGVELSRPTTSPTLTHVGITAPMLEQYEHWLELQYHLGRCQRTIKDDEVAYWRGWWRGTVFEASDVGLTLIALGDDMFEEGVRDDLRRPAASGECGRVLASWMEELGSNLPLSGRNR
jgi:hypothetical protein